MILDKVRETTGEPEVVDALVERLEVFLKKICSRRSSPMKDVLDFTIIKSLHIDSQKLHNAN